MLYFKLIYRNKCLFTYSLFRQHGDHHHFFVRIWFLYGNSPGTRSAGVQAYWMNMLWFLNQRPIAHWGGREGRNGYVFLRFPRTYPCMTTPWSRSHLRLLQLSGETITSLHRVTKCRCRWWHCIIWRFKLEDSRNLSFGCPICLIPRMEVVSRVSPA